MDVLGSSNFAPFELMAVALISTLLPSKSIGSTNTEYGALVSVPSELHGCSAAVRIKKITFAISFVVTIALVS
jgi:hypothetical protein